MIECETNTGCSWSDIVIVVDPWWLSMSSKYEEWHVVHEVISSGLSVVINLV